MTSIVHRCMHDLLLTSILLVSAITSSAQTAEKPVKVFILAGQSNMEGKAQISLLEHQLTQPDTRERFAHLRPDGKWVERQDVWIKFLNRHGNLAVGYGSPNRIGPELEFGLTVGNHYEEQVLLIKTAWGGKSLYRDFRPPSSGLPSQEVLESLLANARKRKPDTTPEEIRESFGHYYREMLADIDETLTHLDKYFPQYKGQGYELAGFIWFQGWNDMINEDYTAAYADNMAHFIRDVRRDLKSPELPFVIGQLGVGGVNPAKPNPKRDAFKAAQAAPAGLPEFADNVCLVPTDVYWDTAAEAVFNKGWREHLEEWQKIGSDYPFHYLGSVKTYSDIGRAFARGVLSLQGEGE